MNLIVVSGGRGMLKTSRVFVVTFCLLAVFLCPAGADGGDFARFDTRDTDPTVDGIPAIAAWRVVELDSEYGGQWVVAGDLDNDGRVEFVSSQNVNKNDVHYTSTAVAQRLDGSILWRWGDPEAGRRTWHHDVACQIHDWDADGTNDVLVCAKGAIVELDGRTGREIRRIEIAEDATDCLVFCDLSGAGRASDVLVKDRYHAIYAYDVKGKLLWSVKDPGGSRTAHQPRVMDVDGDGRDEIMAGYALLNADGSVRWTIESEQVDQDKGHLDCARVFRRGEKPEDWRIVLTRCGANNIAMIDGAGQTVWERSGRHFESIDIGRVVPGSGGSHILVDIDHQPYGKSPMWVMDEKGKPLGQIVTNYSRHHCLLDWDGDGLDEIIVAHSGGLYDHKGRRVATFATPGSETDQEDLKYETSLLTGDFTGDGVPDLALVTPHKVYVYKNTSGSKPDKPIPLGTEPNSTLY